MTSRFVFAVVTTATVAALSLASLVYAESVPAQRALPVAIERAQALPSPAYGDSFDGPIASRRTPAPEAAQVTPGAAAQNPGEARSQGAAWLKQHQRKDGGWGAGNWGQDSLSAPSDVATTAVAVMALVRDGEGVEKHREAIERAITFVVESVEKAPEGPRLATPENTQPQYKLGRLVDTHLAALVLGDLSGRFGEALNVRVNHAWDKVLGKVQLAQQADGSFDTDGWAPVLSTSLAAQSLYQAAEAGRKVDEDVLKKSERYQAAQVDSERGEFATGSAAGVELYSVAGALRTNSKAKGRGDVAAPAAEEADGAARQRISADADGRLVAGFGSIGGEEMLAYMMISDTLAEEGGEDWASWEKKIGGYLTGIQNGDGSWSGHHCITSTVFVTAAAVMTLGAEENVKMRMAKADRPAAGGLK